MKLPKINLGVSNKRSYFDKNHDVNTTSDFGFCQPTLFDEVIPDTTVRLKTNLFARLNVMPQPTFGRVKIHTYNCFIPRKDVFLAWDYYQAQQTVTSYNSSYVPNKTNSCEVKYIFDLLTWVSQHMSYMDYVLSSDYGDLGRSNSLICFWRRSIGTTDPLVKLGSNQLDLTATNPASKLYDVMVSSSNYSDNFDYKGHSLFDASNLLRAWKASQDIVRGSTNIPQFINQEYSWDNADFKYYLGKCTVAGESVDCFATIHLTHIGQRVYKVINGLGYMFRFNKKPVTLDPLFAYYKAWFDLFQPDRNIQWKATPAFRLIHSFYDVPTSYQDYVTSTVIAQKSKDIVHMYLEFFRSLAMCCYSLDIDPITVCLKNPIEGNTQAASISQSMNDTDYANAYITTDDYPYGDTGGANDSSILNRWLVKLLPYVNKNSVIGSRVDEFMRVHMGTKTRESGGCFDKGSYQITISDVMQTAQTAEGQLGDYAGKGIGSGSSGSQKYEVTEHGYIIQLMCVVPFGGYSQAMNPAVGRVNRYDTYQHEFDSLGMAAVGLSEVLATTSRLDTNKQSEDVFGFRPRYMDYKYKNNLRNGGFSLNGQKNMYLPYCLDRIFSEDDIIFGVDKIGRKFEVWTDSLDVAPDESLRFIGQSIDLGNYDRMFLDNLGESDNFIVHMVQDYSITAPMLPIADSFDTFDNEGLKDDTDSTSVRHS